MVEKAVEQISKDSESKTKKKRRVLIALIIILAILLAIFLYYLLSKKPLPLLPGITRKPVYTGSYYGSSKTPLVNPKGVAVNPDLSRIYVGDPGNGLIQVCDPKGRHQFTFGKMKGNEKLSQPIYLAVNQKGNVYVSDRELADIFIFDADGKFIKQFVPDGNKSFIWNPLGIAFNEDGNLYVSDAGIKHRVLVFDTKGKLIQEIGKKGHTFKVKEKKGEFYFPNGLAFDSNGNLYVADGNNRRVQIFTPKGKYKTMISSGGSVEGVAIDAYDQIYIPDIFGNTVDVYKSDAEFGFNFGSGGSGAGEFTFPTSISIDNEERIYVIDRGNNRLQIWSY